MLEETFFCWARILTPRVASRSAAQAAGCAVTTARFAALHGLPVAPSPLDDARSASQTARSSRACMVQGRRSGGLPSAARRRALRSGCDSLGAPLCSPLHLPRSPTADRSLNWIFHAPFGAVRLAVPAIPACARLPQPTRILSAVP